MFDNWYKDKLVWLCVATLLLATYYYGCNGTPPVPPPVIKYQ